MSTHAHTDPLASYTRDAGYGPTNTKTVTRRYEQRLRGVLSRINAAIKRGVVKDDIFGLREQTDTLAVDDPGPFDTDDSDAAMAKFIQWLTEQLDSEFLTVVGPNENPYIRQAYTEGLRLATSQLQDADIPITTQNVRELVEGGRFERGLQTLFTRNFENLKSIRDAVVPEVRETLLEGFANGESPTKIANRMTDRIDSVGKYRATLVARSEIINAHSEGTLDRYEQVSEDTETDIGVQHVGRLTAKDPAVCPFCRRAEDYTHTLSEMRATRVIFRGQEYGLKPPSHPQGRCSLVPKVGVSQDELPPLSERVPGQLIL